MHTDGHVHNLVQEMHLWNLQHQHDEDINHLTTNCTCGISTGVGTTTGMTKHAKNCASTGMTKHAKNCTCGISTASKTDAVQPRSAEYGQTPGVISQKIPQSCTLRRETPNRLPVARGHEKMSKIKVRTELHLHNTDIDHLQSNWRALTSTTLKMQLRHLQTESGTVSSGPRPADKGNTARKYRNQQYLQCTGHCHTAQLPFWFIPSIVGLTAEERNTTRGAKPVKPAKRIPLQLSTTSAATSAIRR